MIKDGSGDHTTIVDAMSAIAAGDTVEIHPGRYPGFQQITLPGQSGPASAFVTKNNITIRGTDRETVIIGPSEANWTGFWPKGIVAKPGTTGLVIESLTIENLYTANWIVGESSFTNVTVKGSHFGVLAFAEGSILVRDCNFVANSEGISVSPPTTELMVLDSHFADLGSGIYVQGVPAFVSDSTFDCGGSGVTGVEGAAVQMVRCASAGDETSRDVALNFFASAELIDCELGGAGQMNVLISHSQLTGSGNTLSQSSVASVFIHSLGFDVDLQRNDILPATGYAVQFNTGDPPPSTIDVRNNYWGVETAQEIEDLILHAPDNVPGITGTALYEPFSVRSVPIRSMSFGQFRSKYGGQ